MNHIVSYQGKRYMYTMCYEVQPSPVAGFKQHKLPVPATVVIIPVVAAMKRTRLPPSAIYMLLLVSKIILEMVYPRLVGGYVIALKKRMCYSIERMCEYT